MINSFVEGLITNHKDGLSRGIDNSIKYNLYSKVIPEFFGSEEVLLSSLAFDLSKIDHYCTFMDKDYIYIYSQPYGYNKDIEGWEQIYFLDDSWYFPKDTAHIYCVTSIYRAPRSDYAVYMCDNNHMPIVLPSHYKELTASEKRFRSISNYIEK